MLERATESPLDCKEINPVNPKGNQSWIFIARTDAEAEAPILWLSDVKNWLIGKGLDAGKCWRQEEKGMTEDEMVGWHHRLNGHEFEQTPGDTEGQGSLACCSTWGCKESDRTQWLNNNNILAGLIWEGLWDFFGRNDAKAETLILWPPDAKNWLIGRLWCWERLKAGGEGDDRGWDGWMVSPTQRTWVWANSRRWWWSGKPSMLQSMGSQRVGHN